MEKKYEMTPQEWAQYEEAMNAYYAYEDENKELLKSIKYNEQNWEDLLDGVDVRGNISFVGFPEGTKQHESHGMFKDVHVDQRSVGTEGDSSEGNIYCLYSKNKNLWLKIPYSC